MCDYSLTDNPAESDMPTEAEPWQPVDLSDVEDKLRKLSTTPVEAKAEAPPSPPPPQEEVDFGSEPEELLLKKPLVSTSALPTSTPSAEDSTSGAASASKEASHEESKDFTSADASTSKETIPVKSNPQPKGPPEVKAPPPAKAPPAGAQEKLEDWMKLRPFLRCGGDVDSDVAMAKSWLYPPPRSSSLPKSSLKPRSKSKASSRAASKEPERSQTPKRGAKSPPRQEEQECSTKKKRRWVLSQAPTLPDILPQMLLLDLFTTTTRCRGTCMQSIGKGTSLSGPQGTSGRAGHVTLEHLWIYMLDFTCMTRLPNTLWHIPGRFASLYTCWRRQPLRAFLLLELPQASGGGWG